MICIHTAWEEKPHENLMRAKPHHQNLYQQLPLQRQSTFISQLQLCRLRKFVKIKIDIFVKYQLTIFENSQRTLTKMS